MRPAHAHLQFRYFAALLLVVLLAACRGERTIQPQIPTPDPALGGAIIYDQPLLVTFSGLNDDAAVNGVNTGFRNQLVRVSGAYAAVTPEACGGQPTNGPRVSWSLVAENLRLDAVGLEQVLALAPEGTQFTIEGVWRVYEGPLGCGKEPAWGVRFYLEAQRIVEPNPLPFVVAGTLDESGAPGGRPAPDGGPETLPADGSPSDGGAAGGTPPPAGTGDAGAAGGTPTVVGTRPTATVMPLATTPATSPTLTATATPTTLPTATPTPGSGTLPAPTPTPTLTNTPPPGASSTPFVYPTPTPIPQATPPPTNTPGGYPGPTPTSESYP